ncbi:MAG: cytochrome ubiquinol oxidase subunit I, partial [Parabacteroides sp.]|nr:cytochrome ubiquinol oxidase subunit I [Parabacteroides sp.]
MDFLSLTDASRLQFAMTAMFHWIFVPLTLGLGFIIAFMETIYVKTGDEFWKKATKYWMKLFAVNFAIGVATGIILEFEFGTNWSNYSWFVGDIFGAPLAIEGIFAFFMESTFFAIMYFGWDKVSKKAHLTSTWLTAFGTNLSAVWILIANAWMQNPVGMEFNPDTARNEMVDFWAVVSSPVAINKIIHTVANGYTLASVVVIGVCGWYLLKKRNFDFSIKSMKVASIFGLISLLVVIATGDKSAYLVAKNQPMKLAAMEGLYEGKKSAPLVAFGILNPEKTIHNEEPAYLFEFSIPYALSYLAEHDINAFVPGINDLLKDFPERQAKGKLAIESLQSYT